MCKKLIYLISIVLLLVTVPLVTHGQGQNLVLNPSFEEDEAVLDDPDWSQWTTWNPAEGAGSNATIVDTDAVDGARSLRVEPVGVENWHFIVLQDYIPLTVGTEYTASFWAKAEAGRPLGAQMKATDNSVSWGYTDFQLTTEWAEYTMTSPAESGEGKLELLCAGSEVPFLLDFVSVYEESAPLVLNGSFEEDEPILILESMKMEIPVSAPEGGKVVEILVEPEQTVTEGAVVARIEV